MSIKISKAKLSKGGTLELSYIDEDGNNISMKGKNPAHIDLKTRLAQLVPFMTDLTEQREAFNIDWENLNSAQNVELLRRLNSAQNVELLRRLEVTGLSISDDSVSPFVTLIGKRTLVTSKVLNICVPSTSLNADDEDYIHLDDFRDAVYAFLYEAELYVTERKWAVIQAELDFSESSNDDPYAIESEAPADAPVPQTADIDVA